MTSNWIFHAMKKSQRFGDPVLQSFTSKDSQNKYNHAFSLLISFLFAHIKQGDPNTISMSRASVLNFASTVAHLEINGERYIF